MVRAALVYCFLNVALVYCSINLTPVEMELFPMAIVLTFLWTKAKGKIVLDFIG